MIIACIIQINILSLFHNQKTKTIMTANLTIGQEVTRTTGDYVVGRKGTIVDIKGDRVQVAWYGENKTWVNVKVITKGSVEVKPNNQSKKEELKALQIEQLKKQLEIAEKLQNEQRIKVAKYRLEQAMK